MVTIESRQRKYLKILKMINETTKFGVFIRFIEEFKLAKFSSIFLFLLFFL